MDETTSDRPKGKRREERKDDVVRPAPSVPGTDPTPGEPGERSDRESIGRPVQLDQRARQPARDDAPADPAHADKAGT